MRKAFLIILLFTPALSRAEKSFLPAPLEGFLGPPPSGYEQHFLKAARELKSANELLKKKNWDGAIQKLLKLGNGEMGEHALFTLTSVYREKNEFSKSSTQGEKLLKSFPLSLYAEKVRNILDQNECRTGSTGKGEESIQRLLRCFSKTPWKNWNELETEAQALYEKLKHAKSPLLDPFVSELLQAIPASSTLKQKIASEIPSEKLEKLSSLARLHTKNSSPLGVKAVSPDVELFDSAMKLVLKENWKEANAIFKRFPAEFPQSEHWDRAQFWIARTEQKLGNEEEAKKRFTQILADTPFTYYGLAASFYLKHDWLPQMANPNPAQAVKWTGSLTTRQALSLWRLRALLQVGLLEFAREEAKTLASIKANGAGIGQEDPNGALKLAELFSEAGYHMAAFSQAYAALSLDPALISRNSVSLIFPQPFIEEFLNAESRSGVNALLLLSVAKQESAFLPNAVSKADALGLMQLLPSTAKEVLPGVDRDSLFHAGTNTEAGSLYLYKLLDRYQGNIPLALAAYNAGPSRVSQWLRDLGESPRLKSNFDPDAFIDSIPFSETRKYVANILRNYVWYKMLAKDTQVTSMQELIFQWQKSPKRLEKAEIPATQN